MRALLAAFVVLGAALPFVGGTAGAQAPTIAGEVASAEEGPMEGVLVSVQKAGAPISITVVTDANGRFRVPGAKLSPGSYSLRIRAVGYDLDGPQTVTIPSPEADDLQLGLRKTEDLAAQLTNTEWLMSMPGTAEQKRPLIECMSCHTLERIVRSKFDAEEFAAVLRRMTNYANNTTMARVQPRIAEREVPEERVRKVAAYLASVNLSAAPTWSYPLKTLPRPKGRATRVVITEYDLPRPAIAPHDVRADRDGMIWYSNFVEPFLGRLDPRTGEHAEYAVPVLKPGFPTGSLAMEPDEDGNWWLALMFQGGLAKFDVRTKRFAMFPVPPEMNGDTTQQSMVMPRRSHVDGKVWTNEVSKQAILRLDLASGRYESFEPFAGLGGGRTHSPYGLAADAANDLYFMDFGDESIGRVDAKTGAVTLYPTPTQASRPRRTMLDAHGHLWFAEFAANKLAMFDIKQETFKEWDVPTPHTYPYDVFLDKNSELWSGSMSNDRILRFDPQSGAAVEYLLPRQTNIRRVFVDDTTTPVTFWAGNNHGAAIVKLEPLE
ncbi:MAG: carboxypeptidase regulatory-like domain-containing protein [Bradyrhizobiaceae bacterium]|nr:carboxypeptidase regulatory-like domain-containing protein [Hyphomicrobiales bacterium]MBV9428339.1 carboxypeptidase regulatory-like domain-containing protein [Bradyrhizobiaceae bacterium]